jgi:hypothetical protein
MQGDPIGRIFAFGAIVKLGQFFWKTTELARNIGLVFSYGKNLCIIFTKTGWATFWVFFRKILIVHFSQVHTMTMHLKI